tara:strand:+ start:125 stop:376 length:252 start_codon:yes stop_codon:yes gene_type:complete
VDAVSHLLNEITMTIQYDTDRDILIEVSNIFNAKDNLASAYRRLDTYLRHECGLEEHEVDDVVDRLEEQVTEHIIEIIESKQA